MLIPAFSLPLPALLCPPPPHSPCSPFSIGDASISYTYATSDSVPYWAAVVVPLIFFVISLGVGEFVKARALQTAAAAFAVSMHLLIDVIGCFAIVGVLTDVFKNLVGRLRPDFLSRCGPAGEGSSSEAQWGGSLSTPTCVAPTVDADALEDGHRSFPSGHSSTVFVLAVYSVAYCVWAFGPRIKALEVAARRAGPRSFGARLLATLAGAVSLVWILLQLSFAWGTAVSRVVDFRHHPSDIVGGALLGTMFAVLYAFRAIGRIEVMLAEFVPETTLQNGCLPDDQTMPQGSQGRGIGEPPMVQGLPGSGYQDELQTGFGRPW